jgi:hypothetical protein
MSGIVLVDPKVSCVVYCVGASCRSLQSRGGFCARQRTATFPCHCPLDGVAHLQVTRLSGSLPKLLELCEV